MITRFAPSPTGPLHLGHAYSALTVWRLAAEAGGTALLRIEDLDSERCRPEFEAGIYEDLRWLGLDWPNPVRRQSDHTADYDAVLDELAARGLLYPCSCSRRRIIENGGRPGPEGVVYPGTCRNRPMSDRQPGDALRLNLAAALEAAGPLPGFEETGPIHPGRHEIDGAALVRDFGDPVLRRRGTGDHVYLVACPHDDALQGVTHVVRGMDLWFATPLFVLLQRLMGWPVPLFHHHDLVRDEAGKRLAKVTRSRALATYRAEGCTVEDIRRMIGL